MNYLESYDNVVMQKCKVMQTSRNQQLKNIAEGRVTTSLDGGYTAVRPITVKDLAILFKSKDHFDIIAQHLPVNIKNKSPKNVIVYVDTFLKELKTVLDEKYPFVKLEDIRNFTPAELDDIVSGFRRDIFPIAEATEVSSVTSTEIETEVSSATSTEVESEWSDGDDDLNIPQLGESQLSVLHAALEAIANEPVSNDNIENYPTPTSGAGAFDDETYFTMSPNELNEYNLDGLDSISNTPSYRPYEHQVTPEPSAERVVRANDSSNFIGGRPNVGRPITLDLPVSAWGGGFGQSEPN